MDKLKMHTSDKLQEHVAQIAALFPNAVTETIQNGKVVQAIDFDVLRQELSDGIVEGPAERYQFTWPDKKKSVLLTNAPINKTLRPCREESVDFDTTENLYIEGDNLDALKLLQETYLGKVKMIYIDPPYNTGNDFVYADDFARSSEDYKPRSGEFDAEGGRLVANLESNGRFHTDWLNMMYPRLKLAKDLLSEDGVIFISIDDNELNNLIKLCNEALASAYFVAIVPWKKRTAKSDVPFGISQDYEWIVCYAKKNFLAGIKHERKYYQTNDFPNDRWRLSDLTTQRTATERPNSAFNMIDPKTNKSYPYNPKRVWGVSTSTFQEYYNRGKIVFPDDYDFLNITIPAFRVFESEDKQKALKKYGLEDAVKAVSTQLPDNIGMSEDGTKELSSLLGGKVFAYPKPTSLIKHFLSITSNGKDFIVMDFFSGSSTTAHAVMQLNAEDQGKRKFIMVQLPEATDKKSEAYKAGYKNICEIGKERIRRASTKIKDEAGKKAKNLDNGFRVLKVDSSNLQDVYYTPAETKQIRMAQLADNIKPERSAEDLLFQVMLGLGVLLSSKIETLTLGGKTVFSVADGYLLACFDKEVSEETITEIARRKPYYTVLSDSSIANDSVAANFEQIFATHSPTTVRKVL